MALTVKFEIVVEYDKAVKKQKKALKKLAKNLDAAIKHGLFDLDPLSAESNYTSVSCLRNDKEE
jgi:hypothetical protein